MGGQTESMMKVSWNEDGKCAEVVGRLKSSLGHRDE